ncbi:hypothetical protein J4414_01490 [Candidatus Woesearchaeota archaeon]|nr:hypothetical protein [Candidatus Woesearchaeota archaeon]
MKFKKLFSIRVWILIFLLILAIIAIAPKFNTEGVEIKFVDRNSKASENGLQVGEIIKEINNQQVNSVADYNRIMKEASAVSPKEVKVETTKGTYVYDVLDTIGFALNNLTLINTNNITKAQGKIISINEKNITNDNFNNMLFEFLPSNTIKIRTNRNSYAFLINKELEISVDKVEKTNLRKGLDLKGGIRVLLKPVTDEEVTNLQIRDLIKVLNNRLNIFGLSDVRIRQADVGNDKLVVIELARTDIEGVRELIEEQGKFEAKIKNDTVFIGGERDITFVCRDDGTCSGIRNCAQSNGAHFCSFEFLITLSSNAAKKHAEATKDLDVNLSGGGRDGYLTETLDFYVDDELVDSLNIGASLKGQEATQILISGSGSGNTRDEAYEAGLEEMDKLQTILITGGLPFDIEILKLDVISPVLGDDFVKTSIYAGLLAILSVGIVIFIRYRMLKIAIPMIFIMLSELLLILGIASIIKWNLDLAAIAGIIASIGTGVDDQIIITDETLKGDEAAYNWKEKIKRAFFIIMVAYATTFAAMIPLYYSGAGLLRGFAVVTIIGISIGVFITRPVFGKIIETLLKKE